MQSDRVVHLLKRGAASYIDTLHPDLFHEYRERGYLRADARQNTNQAHLPPCADSVQRAWQGTGATDFHDIINPLAAGQFEYLSIPVRCLLVVDTLSRAEHAGPLQFFLAAGNDNNLGTRQAAKLQCEKRYATRALHQHRLAGFKRAPNH